MPADLLLQEIIDRFCQISVNSQVHIVAAHSGCDVSSVKNTSQDY